MLSDSVDLDLGELLAVAIELLESFATDLLENKHLLSLDIVVKNGCLYNGSLDVRCSYGYRSFLVEKKHLVKLYGLVLLLREAVYEDLLSCLNLELLACNVYDCVHDV